MSLEGKTISRVVDLNHNGQALIFSDGTALHITGDGYEDSCATLSDLTAMDVFRMEAEREEQRRQDAVSRERAIARRELKERIKRNVSPQAWLNWQRIHVSNAEHMLDLMRETWSDDMNRQAFGGFSTYGIGTLAAIPVTKTKARRT